MARRKSILAKLIDAIRPRKVREGGGGGNPYHVPAGSNKGGQFTSGGPGQMWHTEKSVEVNGEHLKQAVNYRTGTAYYRARADGSEPGGSIDLADAKKHVMAIRKMNLTQADLDLGDEYLGHLAKGYNIDYSTRGHGKFVPRDFANTANAAEILYRQWPDNVSRMSRLETMTLLQKHGFNKPMIHLVRMEHRGLVAIEIVADLDQIGLSGRYRDMPMAKRKFATRVE